MPLLLLLTALASNVAPAEDAAVRAPDPRSVYELVPKLDIPVTALAVLGGTLPYVFADQIIEPICPCDPATINRFDRWAVGYANGSIGALSTVVVAASILFPAVLDAKLNGFTRVLLEDVAILFQALAINGAFTVLAKYSVQRPIPLVYQGNPEFVGTARAYRAFYSGHVSNTATALSVMAMTVSRRYGFSVWPWVVTGVVSGAVGVARIASGYHFPSDVIVGLLAGTAVGIVVPALHFRPREDEESSALSLSLTPNGAGLAVTWR